MGNILEDKHNNAVESIQTLLQNEEMLARVIDCFPYPIQVYDRNGTSVLVNKAMLSTYHNITPDMVVGKYNIFKDPYIIASGQIPVLKRAFQGETVYFRDVRVPVEDIVEKYGIQDFDIVAMYQDITVFPIPNEMKQVVYVVAFMMNRRVYRGKDEIEKAKEFMESHWLEKFDLAKTAKAAFLSKAHFTKLFKKHTGITPHEYYVNYKIGRVKEKLQDISLPIAQAFTECNMSYNGYSARVFKEKIGVSPSDYRKMLADTEPGQS